MCDRLLSPDTIAIIFTYLDAASSIRSRYVCSSWRRIAGDGCCLVAVRKDGVLGSSAASASGPRDPNEPEVIGRVRLVGRRAPMTSAATPSEMADRAGTSAWSRNRKRTRGHLPEPTVVVLKEAVGVSEVIPMKLHGAALRIDRPHSCCEGNGDEALLLSLDVGAPTLQVGRLCSLNAAGQNWTNDVPCPSLEYPRKPVPLKRTLTLLDLSGLRGLEALAVRGCTSLEILRLPPCLRALDASACSKLRRISFPPAGGPIRGLTALNLNGCRSVSAHRGGIASLFGSATESIVQLTRELDLSSTKQLSSTAIAAALSWSSCLVSVSLRYVATDEILKGLAESCSSRATLQLVDVAFSVVVSDEGVTSLIDAAPMLERLNLRGCRLVSISCYNEVPIQLEERRRQRLGVCNFNNACKEPNSGAVGGIPMERDGYSRLRRKGDNVFFFAASTKGTY